MITKEEKSTNILNIAKGSYMLFKSPNYVDFAANNNLLVGKLGTIYRDKCATILDDDRVFHFSDTITPEDNIENTVEPIPLNKEWLKVLTSHISNGNDIFIMDKKNGEVSVKITNGETYHILYVHHLQALIELMRNSAITLTGHDKAYLQKSLNIKII